MHKPILYVGPKPPTVSGIADHGARFREALRSAGIAFEDVAFAQDVPTRGELIKLRAEIERTDVSRYRLAHLELARFSYREYAYARALRRRGLPLVLTVHEPIVAVERPFRHLGLESKPRPVRIIRKLLDDGVGPRQTKALLRGAARLVTFGQQGVDHLVERWNVDRTRCRVIPALNYPSIPKREHSGPRRIVFGGFFSPDKGADILLDAFSRLRQDRPDLANNVKLVFAGATFSGENNSFAELIAQTDIPPEQIERLGFLSATQLQELFADADIAVVPYLPSVPGTASAMLIRALSAGVATVCSDIPSLTQDVTNGKTALVFPPGDSDVLAACLGRLLADGRLRKSLGRAAAAETASKHSPELIGRIMAGLYKEVAR